MPRTELKQKIMPFGEHLEELRRRLVYALMGIVPILIAALVVGQAALAYVIQPIQEALHRANLSSVLQATSVLETFGSYLKVAITITLLVGLPWILLQLWLFVAPGLYMSEKRFAYLLAPLSVVLSLLGILFCYGVMLPIALAFFVHFGASLATPQVETVTPDQAIAFPRLAILEGDPVDPKPGEYWLNSKLKQIRVRVDTPAPASASASGTGATGTAGPETKPVILGVPLVSVSAIAQQYRVSEYVGFLLSMIIAFALAFQTPVVVLLLGWANIITPKVMSKYRRHAIFACAAAAAIITPTPDPFTMLLLAGPLYGLYELGLLLLRVLPASRVAEGGMGLGRLTPRKPEPNAGDE